MKRVAPAQRAVEAVVEHGEGPMWDWRTSTLYWVDMLAGDLMARGEDGAVTRRHLSSVVAAVRPRRSGGLVVAVERGFVLLPDGPDASPSFIEVWRDPAIRMNEGGCDPAGRFYAGSMAYAATPQRASLWRLDSDLHVERVIDGVTISNGLAFTPNGERCYYVDSPTARVDVFDVDPQSGVLSRRRPFVTIAPNAGMPDGITLDAEGGIWVALWGGGAVHRYDPQGRLDLVVPLPVPQVTACTFGGPALDQLYITTSRLGLELAATSDAGALFVASPGYTGIPTMAFAG